MPTDMQTHGENHSFDRLEKTLREWDGHNVTPEVKEAILEIRDVFGNIAVRNTLKTAIEQSHSYATGAGSGSSQR